MGYGGLSAPYSVLLANILGHIPSSQAVSRSFFSFYDLQNLEDAFLQEHCFRHIPLHKNLR